VANRLLSTGTTETAREVEHTDWNTKVEEIRGAYQSARGETVNRERNVLGSWKIGSWTKATDLCGGVNYGDGRKTVIEQFSRCLLTLRQETFFGLFGDNLHVDVILLESDLMVMC